METGGDDDVFMARARKMYADAATDPIASAPSSSAAPFVTPSFPGQASDSSSATLPSAPVFKDIKMKKVRPPKQKKEDPLIAELKARVKQETPPATSTPVFHAGAMSVGPAEPTKVVRKRQPARPRVVDPAAQSATPLYPIVKKRPAVTQSGSEHKRAKVIDIGEGGEGSRE
jgi:hypothetical protein